MRRVILTLTALLLAGCVAAPREPYALSEAQIRPYIAFVEAETGYKITRPPRVLVDRDAMIARGRQERKGFYEGAWGYYAPSIETIYLDHTRYIFGNAGADSVLIHELTHHAQLVSGRWTTECELEREAYRMQNLWLVRQGAQPFPQSEIDKWTGC